MQCDVACVQSMRLAEELTGAGINTASKETNSNGYIISPPLCLVLCRTADSSDLRRPRLSEGPRQDVFLLSLRSMLLSLLCVAEGVPRLARAGHPGRGSSQGDVDREQNKVFAILEAVCVLWKLY